MHHICQFSLCRLQVESCAIGREVQVWFQVLEKKVSFSALSSLQIPLGVSKVIYRSHKENEFFPLAYVLILLQQGCNNPIHGCKAKYKVVTTMFHGCYNLKLQPCYNLVAPL